MQKNSSDIMLILKSLAVNHPIHIYLGLGFPRLIIVIGSRDQLNQAMDILSVNAAPRLSEYMPLKDVERTLCNTNSEVVIVPYSKTRKGKELIHRVETAVEVGSLGDERLTALPIVFADSKIGNQDTEDFFTVRLSGQIDTDGILEQEIVPRDDQLEVVFDRISSLDLSGKGQEERALMAAVCFLYPMLRKSGEMDKYDRLLVCAQKLVQQDEDDQSTGGLADAFVDELYEWQERTGFYDAFCLPYLEMQVVERFDEVVLYDDKFVYMKEVLFNQITEPLLDIYSEDALKLALADAGILRPENARTYTSKANYYDIVGKYNRVRMLRFCRAKLQRPGDLGFVELCCEEEGGWTDED